MRKFYMQILQICPPNPSGVVTLPWEIQKSHFQQYYSYIFLIIYVISEENKLWSTCPPPPKNVTTLVNCIFFHSTKGLLRSFKRWRLWREPVVVCRRWLWKKPVVMCGHWNARQAVSQQVFRVTIFCINTCFQSFLTLVSPIVHHAVLKFSLCRNKPLP